MNLTFTPELKATLTKTLSQMKAGARRLFMASVVKSAGRGGAALLGRELGWNRVTLGKGLRELESGIACADATHQRGRKALEVSLPRLEADLRALAEASSQTDPTFRTTQLYRRLTSREARRHLIEVKGYDPKTVPSARSLRRKLTALGFNPRRVAKSKPLKKVPETDAIFDEVKRVNQEADQDPGTVRVSLDTKAVVAIGDLSRGGSSRQGHKALDHDFTPDSKVTPFGIHRPDTSETWLFFTTGSVTADFMVDRLNEIWPTLKKTVILHIPSSSTRTTGRKTAESGRSG